MLMLLYGNHAVIGSYHKGEELINLAEDIAGGRGSRRMPETNRADQRRLISMTSIVATAHAPHRVPIPTVARHSSALRDFRRMQRRQAQRRHSRRKFSSTIRFSGWRPAR